MKQVTVSAPGKLMIMGEHGVVFGYPSLVTAVDTRMFVRAEFIDSGKDVIVAPQVKESRFVETVVDLFKEKFKIEQVVKIETRSDFLQTVGLGSSSAVTVATFRALADLVYRRLTLREIFDLSYQVTLKIQGVGSGFDIAAATFGGVIYYLYGGKKIEKLLTKRLPLVIGYSGVKADTPALICKVKRKYERKKEEIGKIFEEIGYLVDKAKRAILNADYPLLGRLMNQNHGLLCRLGVSTKKLDKMVEVAIENGAWGAKLSGAGGGDCMIALVDKNKRSLVETAIERVGGVIIKVDSGADGVRREN